MRVTHVITRLIVGGAQENTIASVLGLSAIPGIQIDLLSGPTSGSEGTLEPEFLSRGGRLAVIPELVRPVHPWKDLLAYRQLLKRFELTQPDIVHTHSGKAGVLGRLAAARAGVRVILHTVHGPSFGSFQNPISNALFRAAERRAARVTSHFITVADAMRDQYLAAGIGRTEDYTTIPSGFALEPFLQATNDPAIRYRFGLTEDDIVVGKIARLFKLKGHDDLFAVAPAVIAACPRIKFLLVGDGLWRQRFESLAASLGLQKHFVFTGLVPPREVPGLIGIMDVVVHLSRREGLARALPQALAAGKPIVTYDCDGAREVCLDQKTGFLVSPGDHATFAARLLQLSSDSNLRHRFGAGGQTLVRHRFDVSTMVSSLHSLYLRFIPGES